MMVTMTMKTTECLPKSPGGGIAWLSLFVSDRLDTARSRLLLVHRSLTLFLSKVRDSNLFPFSEADKRKLIRYGVFYKDYIAASSERA